MKTIYSPTICVRTTISKTKAQHAKIRKIEGMLWDWSAESITAIGTVALAVIALAVAVLEGHAMRKHNYLSMQPILTIDINQKIIGNGIFSINFDLRNAGIGPAIIKDIELYCEKVKIPMKGEDATEKFKKQYPLSFDYHGTFGSASNINVIEAGKCISIFQLTSAQTATNKDVKSLRDTARHIVIKIEYQSIHQNKNFTCTIGYSQLKNALLKSEKELEA